MIHLLALFGFFPILPTHAFTHTPLLSTRQLYWQDHIKHIKHNNDNVGWKPFNYRRHAAPKIPKRRAHLFPLIPAHDTWGNWVVLTGAAAVAPVLGTTTFLGRLLGPPVTAMALTFLLATFGVVSSGGTAAATALQQLALRFATPLILLGADLRQSALRQCGALLISFVAASLATLLGSLVGWHLTGPALSVALGHDGLIIAAALLAKNIGGGINYLAVCSSLRATPTAVAAGLCVDNLFALVYFPATSALAAGRPDLDRHIQTTNVSTLESTDPNNMTVPTISTLLWLSSLLLWMGERLGGSPAAALPVGTILTILVASRAPVAWVAPLRPTAERLGTAALYLFFATAGAPGLAVADSVKAAVLPLSMFLTALYAIHGLFLTLCYKVWGTKLSSTLSSRFRGAFVPQRLLVASSAAIGGPATSVALAQAAGWESLQVPGLIVGNIGYAVATFAGLAYFALLRQ